MTSVSTNMVKAIQLDSGIHITTDMIYLKNTIPRYITIKNDQEKNLESSKIHYTQCRKAMTTSPLSSSVATETWLDQVQQSLQLAGHRGDRRRVNKIFNLMILKAGQKKLQGPHVVCSWFRSSLISPLLLLLFQPQRASSR